MNHKPARLIKNHKTATVLVTSTAAVGTGHTAFADNGNNTKGFKNDGISLPTNTKQNQETQKQVAPTCVERKKVMTMN